MPLPVATVGTVGTAPLWRAAMLTRYDLIQLRTRRFPQTVFDSNLPPPRHQSRLPHTCSTQPLAPRVLQEDADRPHCASRRVPHDFSHPLLRPGSLSRSRSDAFECTPTSSFRRFLLAKVADIALHSCSVCQTHCVNRHSSSPILLQHEVQYRGWHWSHGTHFFLFRI